MKYAHESCCMLVACKAQRENESQYLSMRNRQRVVVIVIHIASDIALRNFRDCSEIPHGDNAQKQYFQGDRN